MFIKSKLKKFTSVFSIVMRMFRKVWNIDCGKKYIFIKLIVAIIDSVVPLIYMIFPGLIVNDLTGEFDVTVLLFHVVILVASPFIYSIISSVLGRKSFKYYQDIDLQYTQEFEFHTVHMDYELLENPEIQDLKDRANDVLHSLISIVDTLFRMLKSFIQLISIISLISLLHPLITCMSFVTVLLNALLVKKQDKKEYENNKVIQSKIRKQYGIVYNLHTIDYAKDVKLFDIGDFLINKVMEYLKDINKDTRKSQAERAKINISQSLVNMLNESILYGYAIYDVLKNNLAIGNMMILLTSAKQFSSSLSELTNIWVALSSSTYKYEEYEKFIAMPLRQYGSGGEKLSVNKNSVIEFRDVSFKYPNSDKYILKNINIKIKLSEKLCIVGKNGAGKTTFVKLLTRIYSPTQGGIFIDGININKFSYKEYMSLFTAVFQDSKEFNLTFAENIAFTKDYDARRLDAVCKSSGIFKLIQTLPKKYNTQIGKWIDPDGINLSGGELQRMLIARAVYRGGILYLLDEPTAALDPMAEYEIYTQFTDMINDNCAVLITHRLSAVQLADKVAVFDDGRVAEYGTHSELYAKGGIYTEMFDKQAKFYRDEPCENAEGDFRK